jgi:hypothetical protein
MRCADCGLFYEHTVEGAPLFLRGLEPYGTMGRMTLLYHGAKPRMLQARGLTGEKMVHVSRTPKNCKKQYNRFMDLSSAGGM